MTILVLIAINYHSRNMPNFQEVTFATTWKKGYYDTLPVTRYKALPAEDSAIKLLQ